jgi:O-antigen/teichoic acid export membrane protein
MLTRLRNIFHHLIQNDLLRRIVRNSSYLFSATGISAALSMVQSILAARLLGVEDFGLLGTIITFVTVVNKLASFRMGDLVIKYVGQFQEGRDQQRAAAVFKVAVLTEMLASVIAFGLVWVLAPLGARYFAKDVTAAPMFILYGSTVLANLISESSTGLLQIFDRFRRMGVLNVFQSLVTLSVIAVVYIRGGDLSGIIIAYMLGKIIGAIGYTLVALVEATRRWGLGWWFVPLNLLAPQAKEIARFAVNTNLSATLSLVNRDSELLWVSLFRTNLEVGYYKTAMAMANLIQLPLSPLSPVTYPELSREVARKNWPNVRYVMRQGSFLAGGYTLLAGLGLAIFGPFIITLMYGAEFAPSFPALMILLVGFLVANTFYWARPALLAFGQAGYATKVNTLITTIKTVGILVLLPRMGYLGSPIMLTLSNINGNALSVLKVREEIKKQEELPDSQPVEEPEI